MMRYLRIVFCLLILSYGRNSKAQDMDLYQWENRILIVKTDDIKSERYNSQLDDLRLDELGLLERKLVIFQVKDQSYRKGLENNGQWHQIDNRQLLSLASDRSPNFEVTLIGLDAGIKLQRSKVLPKEDLFAIIDGMPMRRQEIRNGEK